MVDAVVVFLWLIDDPNSANDQDDYTISNWLGFFQCSTSIIDTSMFGPVVIEISLAPAGVLTQSYPILVKIHIALHQKLQQNIVYLIKYSVLLYKMVYHFVLINQNILLEMEQLLNNVDGNWKCIF
jgi:hypothetical protein